MSVGIKETKEALVGVNEVGVFLAGRFRDGVQGEDFVAFYEKLLVDADFKSKLQVAWENHQAIPAEIGDLDLGEGLELGMAQMSYVPKYLEALKK